ncbi:MAG: hypothetical protein F4X99_03745 [Gammaproteobacteria bacterium]|nr:hypothetical protein [Gammaproteobacteria bacterium]
MSAVAHYLEDAGIATTGISLVRENTEALRPPRFLWVPFPLGRPLGMPGDASFQRRVVLAALELLDAPAGPVLEDYLEDVPAPPTDAVVACPVSFPARLEGSGTWTAALRHEIALLRPWHVRSVERRGRTTVGIADAPVEDLAIRLGSMLDATSGSAEALPRTLPALQRLKRTLSDLLAFQEEAVTAQPGDMPWQEVRRVLWQESVLGDAILTLRDRFRASGDPRLVAFTRVLVPRGALDD